MNVFAMGSSAMPCSPGYINPAIWQFDHSRASLIFLEGAANPEARPFSLTIPQVSRMRFETEGRQAACGVRHWPGFGCASLRRFDCSKQQASETETLSSL
jgi:hypothetical protein